MQRVQSFATTASTGVRRMLRVAWSLSRGHRKALVVLVALSSVGTALSVSAAILIGKFVGVLEEQSVSAGSVTALLSYPMPLPGPWELKGPAGGVFAFAVALLLASAAMRPWIAVAQERLMGRLADDLRLRAYDHLQQMRGQTPGLSTGEAMHLVDQTPHTAAIAIRAGLVEPLRAGAQALIAIGGMSSVDPRYGLAVLLLVLFANLILPMLLHIDRTLGKRSGEMQRDAIRVSHVLAEQLDAREMIAALGVERAARSRFAESLSRRLKRYLSIVWLQRLRDGFASLDQLAVPVVILVAFAVSSPEHVAKAIVSLLIIQPDLLASVRALIADATTLRQTGPALELLERHFATPVAPERRDQLCGRPPTCRVEELEATLLDGRTILHDISFVARGASLTAIVGRGGTGKSMLLDVIAGRFGSDVDGRIDWDGKTVSAAEMIGYRKQLLRLNQKPQLLQLSVRDFIVFGMEREDASSVDVGALLTRVGLGSSSPVERRLTTDAVIGRDFQPSGFQSQALRLAQLLARPLPPVVLIDEPDSAMSPQDGAEIQRLLIESLSGCCTVLMVTHAPQLLPAETEVVYLEGGRVADVGPHQQLVRRNAGYRGLVQELGHDNHSAPIGGDSTVDSGAVLLRTESCR